MTHVLTSSVAIRNLRHSRNFHRLKPTCSCMFYLCTGIIVKKYQHRLYFLIKLKKYYVDKTILNLFYNSFIKSILWFSFICLFFNLSVKNRNSLQKVVRVSSKIIGDTQRDITKFYEKQMLRKAHSISVDGSHVLYPMFETMLLERHFRCLMCKTNRKN